MDEVHIWLASTRKGVSLRELINNRNMTIGREGIQKAANDETISEGRTMQGTLEQESVPSVTEGSQGREAAIGRLQERLVAERDASEQKKALEEQSRQEAIVRLQERLAGAAKVESTIPKPEQQSVGRENEVADQTEQQERLIQDIEKNLGQHAWDSTPVTNQEKTVDLLSQKSFKEEKVRGKVTIGALTGGVLSAVGGMGAASLGIAESSVALTAGFLGMASFAGAALVIPPALYAWHKYKESRRNKKFGQVYGKSSTTNKRSIWGL